MSIKQIVSEILFLGLNPEDLDYKECFLIGFGVSSCVLFFISVLFSL